MGAEFNNSKTNQLNSGKFTVKKPFNYRAMEPDSIRLAAMVDEFIEEEYQLPQPRKTLEKRLTDTRKCTFTNESDAKDLESSGYDHIPKILKDLTECKDEMEAELLSNITSILEASHSQSDSVCSKNSADCTGACLLRLVMSQLRAFGYDAAICKSRWEHSKNFPGGDFQYIDVIYGQHRYLIDIDFRGQFQIARPIEQYINYLSIIPPIFVGKSNRLLQLIDIMTEAAKRSLKVRDMHLPPWRKLDYMRAKWLSQYTRIMDAEKKPVAPREEVVMVKRIGNKGTETSPIVLDIDDGVQADMFFYKGKVFYLGENADKPNSGSGKIPTLQLNSGCKLDSDSTSEVSKNTTVQWEFPSVQPKSTRKAGLTASLKSGLARQLKQTNINLNDSMTLQDQIPIHTSYGFA